MDAASLDRAALAALLDWYVENGVDSALDDAPHDRYAESARAPQPAPDARVPAPAASSPRDHAAPAPMRREAGFIAPDIAARAAQECAAAAPTLEELAQRLRDFEHAPFRDMAQHFLFCAGAPGARLMVIDVAPGETEEASGVAFSGPPAQLLDNMLAAIGRDRAGAYLSYLSPWRPPGVASLTPPQIAIFAPFARRHVALAKPDVVLLFGEAPARALLGGAEPLSKLRGRDFELRVDDHSCRVRVFSSLDAMLKSAALKPAAWRDLRRIAAEF